MSNKKLTVTQLTIITAVNMMGSGIIMLPTKLARVGTISILSWLVTATGSLALAYVFAKCGRFSRRPGGMNGYASYAFGNSGAFMSGYTYGVSLVIANVAIAITCVGYLGVFLAGLGVNIEMTPSMITGLTIAIIWVTTLANFGGAHITGQIGSITVWGVIIPVVGLAIVGWFWFSPSMYIGAWNPNNLPFTEAVSSSITLTLWAFLGMESACANADAVENPEKNVPIAVLAGTLGAAVIYIFSTNVAAGIIPNADLAASNAPFALIWGTLLGPWAGTAVAGLSVLACGGSLLGWQFTVAMVFKSTADGGMFPKVFSKLNGMGAPVNGMIILATVQTLLALASNSPDLMDTFETVVNLSVITNLIPYILCMAAVFIMQKVHADELKAGEEKTTNLISIVAASYSFYALYASGYEAMMFGGIITFFGWTAYGFIAHRFEKLED